MCVRKENEAILLYLFRMICEQPRAVMAILCLALFAAACYALVYVYLETSEQAQRQTAAYLEVSKLIERVDTRMQALDARQDERLRQIDEHIRQLDIWHKQECIGGK